MQNPSSMLAQYKQEKVTPWTRIDMLLDIYEKAISTLRRLLEGYAEQDKVRVAQLRIKSLSLVALIESGVDLELEPGKSVAELCQFITRCVLDGDVDLIAAGLKALRTIRDGFTEIRPQAIELESTGQIPPLELTSTVELEA